MMDYKKAGVDIEAGYKSVELMKEYGAINAMMSGSGPTVFGLFSNPSSARKAYEALRYGEGIDLAKQVYLTNFYNMNQGAAGRLR
jgi:4-diphosphocytidyl-2-C-methyl-D-erythritol kinase